MKRKYLETEFNGMIIHSFIFEGKTTWVASKIVESFGYKDISKTIYQCINTEVFERGTEFDILIDDRLKEFKRIAVELIPSLKYVARLVIFYEAGLYGFLQFSKKPEAAMFQQYIMKDLIKDFRVNAFEKEDFCIGSEEKFVEYIEIEVGEKNNNNLIDIGKVNTEKMSLLDRSEIFKSVAKSLDTFKDVINHMNISNEEKLLFYVSLFREAGIELDLSFINSI